MLGHMHFRPGILNYEKGDYELKPGFSMRRPRIFKASRGSLKNST